MHKPVFSPADLLLPKAAELSDWSVVACDQYTSEPEYWARVAAKTAGKPSTFHLILPEAWLASPDLDTRIAAVNAEMHRYLSDGIFTIEQESYVYLEREAANGCFRRGLIGKLDLEAYDYHAGTRSLVRPTEGTVESRLPPRIRVREKAPLELPHIMVLVDDPNDTLFAPFAAKKQQLRPLYNFNLMENGGQIRGYALPHTEQPQIDAALSALCAAQETDPLLFAVGDGNHSLATAKACWDALKSTLPPAAQATHPARFALVELVNLHDPALVFEPIHRIVTGVSPTALLAALDAACTLGDGSRGGQALTILTKGARRRVFLERPTAALPVGSLQQFLDRYQQAHGGEIDYIHGDDVTERLAQQTDAVGFLLPAMQKQELFPTVRTDGVLPRKTFSIGHAFEKRFYLECRRIQGAT